MATIKTVSFGKIVEAIQTKHPTGFTNSGEVNAALVKLAHNGAFDKAGIIVFEDEKTSGRTWRTVAAEHIDTIIALWEAEYRHGDAIAYNLLSQTYNEIRNSTRLRENFNPTLFKAIRAYLDNNKA